MNYIDAFEVVGICFDQKSLQHFQTSSCPLHFLDDIAFAERVLSIRLLQGRLRHHQCNCSCPQWHRPLLQASFSWWDRGILYDSIPSLRRKEVGSYSFWHAFNISSCFRSLDEQFCPGKAAQLAWDHLLESVGDLIRRDRYASRRSCGNCPSKATATCALKHARKSKF